MAQPLGHLSNYTTPVDSTNAKRGLDPGAGSGPGLDGIVPSRARATAREPATDPPAPHGEPLSAPRIGRLWRLWLWLSWPDGIATYGPWPPLFLLPLQ